MSAGVLAGLPVSGLADTLYWDTNGVTAGTANPATGTWDQGTTANWSLNSLGTVATQAFASGDTAVFSAGTNNTLATVATVAGTVNPASITFNSQLTTFTLTGGAIDFGVSGSINSSAFGTSTGKSVVIDTPLTASGLLAVSSHGNLTATGGGNGSFLRFNGDNSGLTGVIAITGGLLGFGTAAAAGTGTLTLSNFGGILDPNLDLQLTNNIAVQSTGGTFRLYGGNLTTNFSGAITGNGAINRTDGGVLTLSGSGVGYSGTYNNQAGTTVFTSTDWQNASFNTSAGALTFNPATPGSTVTINALTTVGTTNINGDAQLDIDTGALKLRTTGTTLITRAASTLGTLTSSPGTLTITSVDANGVTTAGSLGTATHTIGVPIVNPAAGTLAVVKNGANLLVVNQANTYTGGTTINAGRWNADNIASFGTGSVMVAGGAQAWLTQATGTYTNAFTVSGIGVTETSGNLGAIRFTTGTASGLITLAGDTRFTAHASTGTISGGIAQAGGARAVEFGGTATAGTFNITTTAASYTGATTISNTTVNVGTAAVPAATNLLGSTSGFILGAAAGTGNGTLVYNLGASFNFNQNVTFNSTASNFNLFSAANASTLTVSSTIGGPNAGGVRITGGQLTLASGANVSATTVALTSTPTDNVAAAIGTLNILPGATLSATFLSIGDGTNTAGIVNQSGGTVTIGTGGNGFRLGHWSNGVNTPGSQYNLTGGVLDASLVPVNVGWDGAGTMNVSGTGVVKAQRLYVDAGGIDFPGVFNLLPGGTIEIGGGGTLTDAGVGSALNLSGGTVRATADATYAAPAIATAATTTTLDTNGFNVTVTGAISGGGTVAKTGAGSLLLNTALASGNSLTVSGGTLAGVVNAGALTLSTGGTLAPGANLADTTIGTTPAESLTLAGGNLRLNLSPTDTTTGGTVNDLVAVSGGITLSGGTITPLFAGTPVTGTYTLATSTGITLNTLPTVSSSVATSRLVYAVGVSGNNLTLGVSGAAASLTWTGGSNAAWDLNTSQNWQLAAANDEKFLAADSVTFDAAGAAFPVVSLIGSLNPGTTTVNATTDYTFTGTGAITGGSLAKSGAGKLTILTNNTYPGTTAITGGSLVLGDGGTSGSIGLGAVTITSPGKLVANRAGTATVAGAISGSGSIEQIGSGVLLLNGTGTYTGGTLISKGTVQLGGATAAGTGLITLGDVNTGPSDIALLSSRDAGATFANAITVTADGTGLVKIGSNGGTVSGGTVYSGTVTLNRPTTIQGMNTDKTLFSGKITGNVGTLTFSGGRRITVRNTTNDFVGDIFITGTGTILQASEGTGGETIPNASSVDVGAGATFQLAGGSAGVETINALTGSGSINRNVAGTQTLVVSSGSFSGAIVNTTGLVAITKTGTGTLTLTGASTYTGGTAVNGGTLLANTPGTTSSAAGTAAVTVNTGGTLGGVGRIGGSATVNLGGILAPGNPAAGPGTLSIASPLTFGTGSTGDLPTAAIELGTGTTSDVIALTGATTSGALTLTNPDQLNLLPLRDITSSTTYTIATFVSVTGTFDSVLVNGFASQSTSSSAPNFVQVVYNAANIQVTVNNLTAVPEPAGAMVAMAGIGLLALRRRRSTTGR